MKFSLYNKKILCVFLRGFARRGSTKWCLSPHWTNVMNAFFKRNIHMRDMFVFQLYSFETLFGQIFRNQEVSNNEWI